MQSSSNSSNSDIAFTTACMGLVMGQHIDIIAIYRRHRCYSAFPGPTATRCCCCWFIACFNQVL